MRFTDYVVVPLRDLGEHAEECEEHEADYWGLFGITGSDAYAIGDFNSREAAELIKSAIQSG